jgi:hypothetical protein
MSALTAAEIQNTRVNIRFYQFEKGIHLTCGDLRISDDVRIRLEVQRGKNPPPPIGWDEGFQVIDGAKRTLHYLSAFDLSRGLSLAWRMRICHSCLLLASNLPFDPFA